MAQTRRWALAASCALTIALAPAGPAAAAAAPPRDPTTFACPADLEGPFTDIAGSPHENNIECLESFGVVSGKTATTFAPGDDVTRGQLATFVARAMALAGAPLDPTPAGFTDLGGSVHTDAINALANIGVITGRTATTFAPDDLATRAQAATIAARSIPELPEAPPDAFTDDEGATAHEENINKLAAVGIIGGVTAETFAPDANLARGAEASFVARALDYVIEVGVARPPQAGDELAAAIDGGNEVPGPGDADAGGGVSILQGGLPGVLCVRWDIDRPFTSAPTAAHIHVGLPEIAGPVLIPLPTPEVAADERLFDGECVSGLDQNLIDAVFANPAGHYVNVHSADFPDGASRGQLAAFDVPLGTQLLGSEEAPGPGEADATGEAFIDVLDDSESICSFVVYEGAEEPMAAHIHEAALGAAGPIVVTLPPFDLDGPVSDGCVGGLDPAVVDDIAANPADYYVNVHTDGHPDGAVRGQLELSTFLGAGLIGAAEVPGPGDDNGSGAVFVDVVGDSLICVELSARGVDRVTAAHIHDGTADVAGPVVVPLPAPVFGRVEDCVEADPALIDDIVANPADFYVNVHTEAFPAGAVRGQLAVEE